jgi:hypothetical protein
MDFLSDTSEIPLLVNYSAFNSWTNGAEIPSKSAIPSTLVSENDLDGMTFTIDPNLKNDTAAYNAFIRALNTWKCSTSVNFNVDPAYPNTNGKICNVRYGDLPNGTPSVLGRVTNFDLNRCKDVLTGSYIKSYYQAYDLIFNDSINFYKNLSPIGIGVNQFDLQTVALHELGHCHLLNHVNQVSDVMYAKIDQAQVKRTLNTDNIAGGNHIVQISGYVYPDSDCNSSPMLPDDINSLGCSSGTEGENTNLPRIIVYPNPVSDKLSIEISNQGTGSHVYSLKIFNIHGKIVKEPIVSLMENSSYVPIGFLSPGVYLIQIKEDDLIIGFTKFVKI